MPRQEYKFRLSPAQAELVRGMILPHVEIDPNAVSRPSHEYAVRSLYFDTEMLDFYHGKLAGLNERIKVRIRGYNEITCDSPVFLEVKKKTGSAIVKRRSRLLYRDLAAFLESNDVEGYIQANGFQDEAKAHAREFLFHIHRLTLGPVITVAYDREAFLSRHDGSLRVTLDRNLRCRPAVDVLSSLVDGACCQAMQGSVIMEVKSDFGLPLWLRLILSRLGVSREALSKYTLCIDSLITSGHRCRPAHSWTAQDPPASVRAAQQ